ncbi:MAG: hypothetical protein K0R54_179 [Clostridiaceae bacterium]|nr:hypothetical protein [Clostridiaceae bacterium]
MKTIKKLLIILSIFIMCVGLLGCSSNTQAITQEDEEIFITEYRDLVLIPSEPAILVEKLDTMVSKISSNNATDAVDGLLYAIHQFLPEMNVKLKALSPGLKEYIEKDFDINNKENLEKITDTTLRGFVTQVLERHMLIEEYNGEYFLNVNYQFVLDKYKDFINEDLKALIEFSIKEDLSQFFDSEKNMFELDIVVERLIKIEENINSYPDSVYIPAMLDSKSYYYEVYFGTNNDFLVDNNNKVLDTVLNHYKATIEKYPDSELAKDIKEYIAILQDTNNSVTDDILNYLIDLTANPNDEVKNESAPTNKEITDSVDENKINDALKEAIEKNK